MNNTLKFRTIFSLIAALFLTLGVQGQTGVSNSKNKSSKTEKTTSKKSESETKRDTDEDVEYYYSYMVLEVLDKNDKVTVTMDRSAFEGNLKLPNEQMGIAKKAAAGGLEFGSEIELLNFMSNMNYELVGVTNAADQMSKRTKMYFKIKLER